MALIFKDESVGNDLRRLIASGGSVRSIDSHRDHPLVVAGVLGSVILVVSLLLAHVAVGAVLALTLLAGSALATFEDRSFTARHVAALGALHIVALTALSI